MRLRLLLPLLVLAAALAALSFPDLPGQTPFARLLLFALSFTTLPLLLVSVLARLTHTEVTP